MAANSRISDITHNLAPWPRMEYCGYAVYPYGNHNNRILKVSFSKSLYINGIEGDDVGFAGYCIAHWPNRLWRFVDVLIKPQLHR